MSRPSEHLQETPRRCKKFSQTIGETARDSQTVCDDAKTVWAPAGDSQTVSQTDVAAARIPRKSVMLPSTSGH
ncbi:hypothetical protein DPMN_068650 [Dreissena polymorpha]|uniref:Uncharacterized protein n=1 Tax=Dreissena polymorpha TaxID=45954 RepID=A0A9D4BWS7_DREPO|nr:hypothetical protein DPMN_068650 [Dreissena polymorpha]